MDWERRLGLVFEHVRDDEVLAALDIHEELLDQNGHLAGGVLCTMAEACATAGTNLTLTAEDRTAVPVCNNTDFVSTVTSGRLEVRARCLSPGPDLWVWRADLAMRGGPTCALSTVSVASVSVPDAAACSEADL